MYVEISIRDEVLANLVELARTDREFMRKARADLEGALHEYGYELTADELAAVREFHRQTSAMSDAEMNRVLAERASSAAMRGA